MFRDVTIIEPRRLTFVSHFGPIVSIDTLTYTSVVISSKIVSQFHVKRIGESCLHTSMGQFDTHSVNCDILTY